MESQSAQETNAPDWTERVWLLLSWVRLVVAVGFWLWLFGNLICDLFSQEGMFADDPLDGQILITLLLALIFSGMAAWAWALLWCGSLLLMPPRFFRNSDSGRKLLQQLPAWEWRLIAITFIAMSVLLGLVGD